MTSKKSTGKVELDVQKMRDEGNWKRLIELTETGKIGSINDQLATFLSGESRLEQYLEEHPPYDQNAAQATTGLAPAKKLLTSSASKEALTMDAQLLLAKLHFACGEYAEALQYLSEAGLDNLTGRKLPTRSLKIVAESFAVQALALEKSTLLSSESLSSKDQRLLKSMETAGDIALLYFQELDKSQGQSSWSIATSGSNSPLPPLNDQRMGLLLETALLRAPLVHIKAGRWMEAIARYRTVLRVTESSATQTLRLTFARQLAEILLRRMCQANYIPPSSSSSNNKITQDAWKPKQYSGSSLFYPKDVQEEVLLLVLISETMAVRDAVLSQSPDFREQRKAAQRQASAVYDLLTLCCVQHDQTAMLCEFLERALKFSFEDGHVWSQFAYSLIAAGRHSKAVLVLREVARLQPTNPLPVLMAAKVCLEQLTLIDEGFELASEACRRTNGEHSNISSRCFLFKGMASFIKWRQSRIQSLKQEWMGRCLDALRTSAEHDPHDHLVHFYLALTYALCREVNQALTEVRMALRLRAEHLPSLLLLALLLSTASSINGSPFTSSFSNHLDSHLEEEEEEAEGTYGQQCRAALSLIEASLEEYPHNFDLLYVKALLEERCMGVGGGETALGTAKHMLALWKSLYEESSSTASASESAVNHPASVYNTIGPGGPSGHLSQSYSTYDTRSIALSAISAQHISNDPNEREGSIYAQSVAAARAEQALSDVTSSLCSNLPRPGPQRAWHVQLKIWLLTGELYVRLGRCDEAMACAQEASALNPASHHVMYLKGLIYEKRNEFSEAKIYFKNATALSPFHVPSLQHLGLVFHYLGSHRLAEKTLRDAVRLDPMAETSWYNLGKVLEAMGEYDRASDCMATALLVQKTSPIVPFSAVPLCFD